MQFSTRNRFFSDEDERDLEDAGEPTQDYAEFIQRWRNPGMTLESAPTDTRQRRSGGGSMLSMVNERNANVDTSKATAGDMGSPLATAQRLEMVQEEPKANVDTPPVKPPGPDSPSTQYKDPASKFMSDSGYDAKRKAYDEDWDASGKYKKFRIETTQQRAARREAQQRDVYLSKQEGVEAYQRAQQATPKLVTTHDVRTPEGKKQTWGLYNDNSQKMLLEGLDELAAKRSPYLSEAIQYDGATGRGFKQKVSGEWEAQMVPAPGAPSDNGMIGPTGADNKAPLTKWIAPERDVTLGYGQTRFDPNTGEVIAQGRDRPIGTATPSSKLDPVLVAAADAAGKDAVMKLGTRATKSERDAAYANARLAVLRGEKPTAATAAPSSEKRIQREGFSWSPE